MVKFSLAASRVEIEKSWLAESPRMDPWRALRDQHAVRVKRGTGHDGLDPTVETRP